MERKLLRNADFYDTAFMAWVQREFDAARHYLKTCGKPKDETDRYMIEHHKFTVGVLKGMLQ